MTRIEKVHLREKIAAALARHAPNAFCDIDSECAASTAIFPKDFSRRETKCFRLLAEIVMEEFVEARP